MLLAGDIGGTKTELAFFTAEAGPREPRARKRFVSADYPDLRSIVREFLSANAGKAESACFAVAGPVIDGCAAITNLSWTVDAAALAAELGLPAVTLLNDLEATALSIPLLKASNLRTLSPGEPVEDGASAVIAPGTGLGEAFLTWESGKPTAHASEGGHADFAPMTDVQAGLLAYLRQQHDHVSVERVCSGLGIPNIYDYLRDTGVESESAALAAALAGADDRTPPIVTAAQDAEPDLLSLRTLELFVEILGQEAGNLALKVLATGGVYLGGGIPKRIVPALEQPRFLEAFRRKGRMTAMVSRIPVHVVLEQSALSGAASYGLQQSAR